MTAATTIHQMMVKHRIDKSGWMLKTGPESPFFSPKWSQRYFVLVGGSLYYYRPQELRAPAGMIELRSDVTLAASAEKESIPCCSDEDLEVER